jgi:glutathione S-transferase
MALTLYLHPLASYCHKVLIALYENAVAFTPEVVDLGNPASRDNFRKVWPLAKFPALRDHSRNQTIPESTCIIEYLERHFPGPVRLVPQDEEAAAAVRAKDRFYDLHVHYHVQKIVTDKIRPEDGHDAIGVSESKEHLQTALQMAETDMAARRWACGDTFSMADCAAAPPLFFIDKMMPLRDPYPHLDAYLNRLKQRASYARVLAEAEPFMKYFPG